eukprot:SAG22_NODE_7751_length_711_cov_1.109477_2_plen_35_part_01
MAVSRLVYHRSLAKLWIESMTAGAAAAGGGGAAAA